MPAKSTLGASLASFSDSLGSEILRSSQARRSEKTFCGHLGGPGCNLPGLLAYLILRTHEEERRQMDKAVGKAKEAYGAITGDEELKAEGRAEQRKADAEAEARQREKRRQAEAAARQAEKERDRQRLKDKGPLGGITDATEDIGGLTDKLTGR
jgi:uncharacterized protein YjbJ (UPF0337 family)